MKTMMKEFNIMILDVDLKTFKLFLYDLCLIGCIYIYICIYMYI